MVSLTTEFDGVALISQIRVGWFLTSFAARLYISQTARERELRSMQLITNKKSHMGFRLVQMSMILNDFERSTQDAYTVTGKQ